MLYSTPFPPSSSSCIHSPSPHTRFFVFSLSLFSFFFFSLCWRPYRSDASDLFIYLFFSQENKNCAYDIERRRKKKRRRNEEEEEEYWISYFLEQHPPKSLSLSSPILLSPLRYEIRHEIIINIIVIIIIIIVVVVRM